MVSVFQNLKYISSEFVAYTNQKQELIKAKLGSITANQKAMANKKKEMYDRMKALDARQYVMGANLKSAQKLLKKKP